VHSPIEGRITKRNTSAASGDTFVHGWAYAIEPKGGASEVRNFLLGAETKAWVKTELARLRDFMAAATASKQELAAVWLQDGGEPMPGVLNHVTPDQCAQFEKQFLSND